MLAPPPALAHRAGHAWEQAVLPVLARRADALLCPANLAPAAARNAVVVIHDAAPLRHPGWYSGLYAAWQRRLLPVLARRARHVVTVSAFSRAELLELLGLEPDRISVVAGGVDPAFHPGADAERARAALGLRRPYVLCVASQTARKNVAALVPAARALAPEGVDVVVAGGHRPQFAAEQGLEPLTLLGAVPDEILPGLYAGAAAFALPSHYEGFGLPVLEAMACGTPVVAADATALPETCGGAAVLVPPEGDAFAGGAHRAARRRRPPRAARRGRPRARRALHLGGDGRRGRRRAQAQRRASPGALTQPCSLRAQRVKARRTGAATRRSSRTRRSPA